MTAVRFRGRVRSARALAGALLTVAGAVILPATAEAQTATTTTLVANVNQGNTFEADAGAQTLQAFTTVRLTNLSPPRPTRGRCRDDPGCPVDRPTWARMDRIRGGDPCGRSHLVAPSRFVRRGTEQVGSSTPLRAPPLIGAALALTAVAPACAGSLALAEVADANDPKPRAEVRPTGPVQGTVRTWEGGDRALKAWLQRT